MFVVLRDSRLRALSLPSIPICAATLTRKSESICASKRPRAGSNGAGERRDCFSASQVENEDALLRSHPIGSLRDRSLRSEWTVLWPRCEPARTTNSATRTQAPRFLRLRSGKINPHDKDYGASIESARGALVGYTIDDLYFWSNAVTLVLLCGVAALLLFQWRAMDKRE